MAVLIMCSNAECGELFDVPDSQRGKQVTCPTCGTTQLVPEGPADKADISQSQPAKPARQSRPSHPGDLEHAPKEEEDILKISPMSELDEPPLDQTSKLLMRAMSPTSPKAPVSPGDEVDLSAQQDVGGQSAAGFRQPTDSATVAEPSETILHDFQDDLSDTPMDGLALLAPDEIQSPSESVEMAGESVLASKTVAAIPFIVGIVTMPIGLVVGVYLFQSHAVLAAYAGAWLGWIAGMAFGFLVVFGAEGDTLRKVRCSVCGNVFPFGTKTCALCGSPLSAVPLNPLAKKCLSAGSYALSAGAGIYWMAMSLVIAVLGILGVRYLPTALPNWHVAVWLALAGLSGWFALAVLCYWMAFVRQVIRDGLSPQYTPAKVPSFWSLRNLSGGLKGLALAVLYVLPVCTFPLMPLALLSLEDARSKGPIGPITALRRLSRHIRDYALLWLFLLLWLGGLALAVVVTQAAIGVIKGMLPAMTGVSSGVVLLIVHAVTAGLMGAVVCIFIVAMSRCVGAFGRETIRSAGDVPSAEESSTAPTGAEDN